MALNFPAKVYQILENESNDIIRWHTNGTAFRIVDHGRFEREIIPKYFRHNQISSVQRQLNLYGFKCISRGEDKGAFFHPKFRRGDWEVVKRITRYAPMKKDSTPAEKKAEANAKNVEEAETNEAPVASALTSLSADSSHFAAAAALGTFSGYTAPMASFPHFDAFFHHPDLAGNWQWSVGHRGAVFPPMPASKLEEPAESEGRSAALLASDTVSNASEATVPQNHKDYKLAAPTNAAESIKPLLRVENNIVTLDPYFELGDEFDLFHCDDFTKEDFARPGIVSSPRAAASASATAKVEPKEAEGLSAAKQTCEMGVNTDLTMGHMNQIYQWCFNV